MNIYTISKEYNFLRLSEKWEGDILNLGLLPKRENCSKGKQRLCQIIDEWLKTMIKEYEFIEYADFQKFSDVTKYQEMFDKRRPIFEKAFSEKREQLIHN